MSKFLRELLIGIAIIILGIWLSVASGYFSEQYEGICFFHVVAAEGMGELKIGIGMQSAAVKIVSNTGLANGIIAVLSNTEHVPSVD